MTRSAVVAGGGRHGLAAALRLRLRGAAVVLFGAEPSSPTLHPARLAGCHLAGGEVQDERSACAAVTDAARMGRLDTAVHHLNLGSPGQILDEDGKMPLVEFSHTVETTLVATFNVMSAAAHQMAINTPTHGGRGVIINSVAAGRAGTRTASDGAITSGLAGMTRALADELADIQIRAVTIMAPRVAINRHDAQEHPDGALARYTDLIDEVVESQGLNGETITLDRLTPA